MKGNKVKCTCGWSWNKSDSSKKDMYICHECGRDNSNNMKNGGWLDNYGKEDNYNDYNVSAPEGFEGDGYSNVGRNYSPAWGGQFQMGGVLPGAAGHMYARHGAPSEGPYAKKTLPNAQNGKEMQYYQNGLDFQPKTISKNGAWLDEYDVAQDGKKVKFNVKQFLKDNNKNISPQQKKINVSTDKEQRSEDYRRWYDTKEYKDIVKSNKAAEDKATIQDRKDRINKSMAAQNKSFTKDNWRKQLADETQAIGDKFRMFPEDSDSFVDEWLNPGVMIGNMASDLGSAPLRAQQEDSYMPYATSIGVPLLTGGFEGLGAKTNKQFVNNLVNPINIVPGYHSVEKYIGNKIGKIETSIAPELRQGLRTNGISFQNNSKRGENAFKLINDETEEWIGDLDLTKNYWDDAVENQWTIDNVGIEKPYRGKGFGKEAYIKANELLNSTGRGSLYSSGNFEGPDAKHLWRSLVNSGHAEEIGKNAWKFKSKLEQGGVIKDNRGQWDHPGEITEINSNDITMEGVPYDVLGISDTGDTKLMKPGKNYKFKGKKVTEYPIAKNGVKQQLDQLTNFSNYNNKQPGGWLDNL